MRANLPPSQDRHGARCLQQRQHGRMAFRPSLGHEDGKPVHARACAVGAVGRLIIAVPPLDELGRVRARGWRPSSFTQSRLMSRCRRRSQGPRHLGRDVVTGFGYNHLTPRPWGQSFSPRFISLLVVHSIAFGAGTVCFVTLPWAVPRQRAYKPEAVSALVRTFLGLGTALYLIAFGLLFSWWLFLGGVIVWLTVVVIPVRVQRSRRSRRDAISAEPES